MNLILSQKNTLIFIEDLPVTCKVYKLPLEFCNPDQVKIWLEDENTFVLNYYNIAQKLGYYTITYDKVLDNILYIQNKYKPELLSFDIWGDFIYLRHRSLQSFLDYLKSLVVTYDIQHNIIKQNMLKRLHFKDYVQMCLSKLCLCFSKKCAIDPLRLSSDEIVFEKNNKYVFRFLYRYKEFKTQRFIAKNQLQLFTSKKNYSYMVACDPKAHLVFLDIKNFEFSLFLKFFFPSKYADLLNIDDVYGYVAQNILSDVSKRTQVKLTLLMYIYGANIQTIQQKTNLHIKDIEKILHFLELHNVRNTKRYQNLFRSFTQNKYFCTPYYSKIFVDEEYKILNYFMQSTAADVLTNMVYKILSSKEHKLLLCVYDAFYFETYNIDHLLDFMKQIVNPYNFKFQVKPLNH